MFTICHSLIHSKGFLGCQLYTSQNIRMLGIRIFNVTVLTELVCEGRKKEKKQVRLFKIVMLPRNKTR